MNTKVDAEKELEQVQAEVAALASQIRTHTGEGFATLGEAADNLSELQAKYRTAKDRFQKLRALAGV